jgi:hypothetical protein
MARGHIIEHSGNGPGDSRGSPLGLGGIEFRADCVTRADRARRAAMPSGGDYAPCAAAA